MSLLASFGGWPLIQNAVFDDRYFKWEIVESQLQLIGIDGFIHLSPARIDVAVFEVSGPTYLAFLDTLEIQIGVPITIAETLGLAGRDAREHLSAYLTDLLVSLGRRYSDIRYNQVFASRW